MHPFMHKPTLTPWLSLGATGIAFTTLIALSGCATATSSEDHAAHHLAPAAAAVPVPESAGMMPMMSGSAAPGMPANGMGSMMGNGTGQNGSGMNNMGGGMMDSTKMMGGMGPDSRPDAGKPSTRVVVAGSEPIVIIADDPLRFDLKGIEAKPGQKIQIQLRNNDPMPKEVMGHNWVLLKAGKDPAAYAAAAVMAKSEDYQPKALADQVFAAIPLLGPKETRSVTFNAPSAPGVYYFLCSFPGHQAAGMVGMLTVK